MVLNFRTRTPKGDGNAKDGLYCFLDRWNFRTRTPKGDGNKRVISLRLSMRRNFRTRTPKGDGNRQPMRIPPCLGRISEHEPRKGTETVLHHPRIRDSPADFGTRTPKGDGNQPTDLRPSSLPRHFRTRTPKGDGNSMQSPHFRLAFFISEHEPRKGTETKSYGVYQVQPSIISEHEPRKGMETFLKVGKI